MAKTKIQTEMEEKYTKHHIYSISAVDPDPNPDPGKPKNFRIFMFSRF
jgi:hypothetical protein